MEESVAKNVHFSGAYVGNNQMGKPENDGSRAIPLDEFLKIISEDIKERNTRFRSRIGIITSRLAQSRCKFIVRQK
jgi:hypothetical protein